MFQAILRRARLSGRTSWLIALATALGTLLVAGLASGAGDLVDMTLVFHGGVEGKIAPCG